MHRLCFTSSSSSSALTTAVAFVVNSWRCLAYLKRVNIVWKMGKLFARLGLCGLWLRDLDWKCIIVGKYDYSGKPEQVSLVTRIPLHYRIHFLLYLLYYCSTVKSRVPIAIWLRAIWTTRLHLLTYQSICYTPKAPLATNLKWVHIIIYTSFKEFRGKWN